MLSNLSTVIAILLGSGAIGSGTWRRGTAAYRKVRSIEQLRDSLIELVVAHDDWIKAHDQHHQEATPWTQPASPPPPPPAPAPPYPLLQANTRGRLPGTPSP